jgi:XTP/dITP diphosphohydrolase
VTTGRVVLLLTSPRVAPGLLGWPAWEALRSASAVWTPDPDHPQLPYVAAAGVTVTAKDHASNAEWAHALLAQARQGATVVWLASESGDPGLAEALANQLAQQERDLPSLEVVPASYDIPGARMLDLVDVMDQLRLRCPWVQSQTHRTLVKYLVEEAYETVEALETGDEEHLREELGDLLFQVVFHSRLAEEHDQPFSLDDVAGDLVAKLIRRNPHVFGDAETTDVAEIESAWDELKAEEKQRASAVEGVPLALPALTLAEKVLGRVARTDLDVRTGEAATDEDALGKDLFALVRKAREAGIDPEQALRDEIRRYLAAVRTAESS